MMHYGCYYTDDPAADAERYFSDIDATYPEHEFAVDLSYRIVVRVKGIDREDADRAACDAVKEMLRGIKDGRLVDTEWLETTDIDDEGEA